MIDVQTSAQTSAASGTGAPPVDEEEQARAHLYRLIGRFLARPPSTKDLANLSLIEGDDTPVGVALSELASVSKRITADEVDREYHDLFIGLGRGELVPYGSYYLTGFLHEKPLAKLRNDLGALGIERAEDVKEPEDHIGALCEVMCALITGRFGAPASIAEQKAFFQAHVAAWSGHFFRDLQAAKSSVFYAAIGQLGAAFVDVEEAAFAIA